MQVLEARWRLLGHVLRRDRNIPANKAMLFYFSDNKRARRRPQTTLPITLNNDLKKLVATKLELTTQTDLDTLRLIAEDRPKWNALVAEIRKTAEAARSDVLLADGSNNNIKRERGRERPNSEACDALILCVC
ncbi:hypothetical protein PoB_003819800 [Plakobranchus ocellatus]|uniref:Uncharacterized protein n=1 Tax=Plakobranchus ocellatus TaxID=259542 RepID=A0AAV4AWJ8_9GAST|nr:hypothetical protein PoB_003819800 [Plakobranchus ocellatus]